MRPAVPRDDHPVVGVRYLVGNGREARLDLTSSETKLSALDPFDELRPCIVADSQFWTRYVLGIAHSNLAGQTRTDLDAVTAVAAVAGLTPAKTVYAFHFSSATFSISSRDCA
jgi:hypothetical protein